MGKLGDAIAELAASYIGEREHGANRTIFGEWAEENGGKNGVAWCGVFASACVQEASSGERAVGEGVPLPKGVTYIQRGLDTGAFGHVAVVGCDHAPTIERWGRGRHRPAKASWVESSDGFEPGDILCIAVPKAGEDELEQHARHVAVFHHFDEDEQKIVAVGGNVADRVGWQRWDADHEVVLGAVRFED